MTGLFLFFVNVLNVRKLQPLLVRACCFALGWVILVGCQTEAKRNTCTQTDWFEIGRQDGVSGHSSQLNRIKRECGGFLDELKEALYNNGYNKGLNEYCSTENGYALGHSESPIFTVCPRPLDQIFLTAYKKGQTAALVEKENQKIDRQISSIREKIKQNGMDKKHREKLEADESLLLRQREANAQRISDNPNKRK